MKSSEEHGPRSLGGVGVSAGAGPQETTPGRALPFQGPGYSLEGKRFLWAAPCTGPSDFVLLVGGEGENIDSRALVVVQVPSRVLLSVTLWRAACQASLPLTVSGSLPKFMPI